MYILYNYKFSGCAYARAEELVAYCQRWNSSLKYLPGEWAGKIPGKIFEALVPPQAHKVG